ncbi:Hypothetical protein PHPALM_1026 [Phytophthora palmivora]|uniref:Uncharacterized protein n=1 Tax=Phytophthora palmivora TaxID=4796 RepID=A0A2P4YTE8_9STRA|nr:Hypothetical protein PHPALM_1026 [Phytophthora palmivora]
MAVVAGAGLDAPGLDPASLKLNARLCRLLAERFPKVMLIPDGEDRALGCYSAASSNSSMPQVPIRQRPSRSVEAIRRVRKDQLTPSQRLRVLANPKSATVASPHKRKVAVPLNTYGQSLPGEEGYEEIATLIGPLDDRLLAASDSELTVPPAPPLPRRKTVAMIATSTPQKAPSAESNGNVDQGSDIGDVSCEVESSSAAPLSPASPAESDALPTQLIILLTSSLSVSTPPATTVPSSPSVVVSVVPPAPTPDPMALPKTPNSSPAQPSSAKSLLQAPSSSIARLLVCKGHPAVPSRTPMVSAGLMSPSGRPLRSATATARQINAQLLENLGTSDNVVLGLGDGSTGHKLTPPSSAGSLSHPLEFSSDTADDDQAAKASSMTTASTAASSAPASSASSSALSRLAQLFGSDDESDKGDDEGSDSADVSAVSVVASSPLLPPHDKIQSYLAELLLVHLRLLPRAHSPSRKHRKKKHKRKHKRRSSSPIGRPNDSNSARPKKKRKAVSDKSKTQKSVAAESGDPKSGRVAPSGSSTADSLGSTSRDSTPVSNPARPSTSTASSDPAPSATRRSAEIASQLSCKYLSFKGLTHHSPASPASYPTILPCRRRALLG